MSRNKSISRKEFIRRFVSDCGFTYIQATQAYESLCATIGMGILNGYKINVGRVCSIKPTYIAARVVNMGFERTKNGVEKISAKQYNCGPRLKYKLSLYKEFIENNSLNWV